MEKFELVITLPKEKAEELELLLRERYKQNVSFVELVKMALVEVIVRQGYGDVKLGPVRVEEINVQSD